MPSEFQLQELSLNLTYQALNQSFCHCPQPYREPVDESYIYDLCVDSMSSDALIMVVQAWRQGHLKLLGAKQNDVNAINEFLNRYE